MIVRTRMLWFADGLTISQRLILLHPAHANDAALLAHERTHQAQMARVGTLRFWWRYLTSKAFRQASEVEAYRVQIAHGASPAACARHLASLYRLGLSERAAAALLSDKD